MDKFKIETERLLLREIDLEDIKNFNILGSNKNITKHLDYIKTNSKAETEKWIQQRIEWNKQIPKTSLNLTITLKDTSEFVGWIGIGEAENLENGEMDFGYAILPKFQRKGFASETLKAVIEYCFKNMKVTKIFGDCDKNNIASRNVMEKVGLKFEKEESEKVYLSISKNS